MDKPVCEIHKNSREVYQFRLGGVKGHKFADMRIFALEDGKDPVPTKKGLVISPQLWPKFRAALDQMEAAMIKEGWLDRDDLTGTNEVTRK